MTFLELCKKVRQECGVQGQGPPSVLAQTGLHQRIVDWTADAEYLIQTLHPDWNFLWAEFSADTTQGSSELTKKSDHGTWNRSSFGIDVGTTAGRSITVITYKEFKEAKGLRQNEAPTQLCILPNENLKLAAPADGTHTITADYWKAPVRMSVDSSVPAIPERFQRIIVARAKMWFFEDIESNDQFIQARDEYDWWLRELEIFALPERQESARAEADMGAVIPV